MEGGEKRLHACTARACTGRNNAPLLLLDSIFLDRNPRVPSRRAPTKNVSSLETTLLHSSCCVVSLVSNKTPFAKRRDGLILSRRFEDPQKIPPPSSSSSFHILFFSIRIDSTISSVEEDRKGVEGRVALPIIPLFCPVQVAAT